jgi:terminal uridylyltransferase
MRYQGRIIPGSCMSQLLADNNIYLTGQIRGEFMRASRILAMRPRAILALSQLCEEKASGAAPAPAPPPSLFVPPRLSLPPQGSFSAGASPMQSRGGSSERHSPKPELFEPGRRATAEHRMPEHMAPKRSQWTSPPPPEASPEHHAMFQDQLDQGIALATASTFARECAASTASGDSLEILNDEESRSEAAGSDDLQSTRSFREPPSIPVTMVAQPFSSRGRLISRPADPPDDLAIRTITDQEVEMISQKADLIRRSQSGPPGRKATNRFSWPSVTYPTPVLFQTSTRSHHLHVQIPPPIADTSTVFYETTATRSRVPQPFPNTQDHTVNVTLSTYPTSGSQLSSISSYQLRTNVLGESVPPSPALQLSDRGFSGGGQSSTARAAGSPSLAHSHISTSHGHVPSVITTAPHPDHLSRSNSQSPSSSPSFAQLAQRRLNISSGRMKSRSPSRSPLRTNIIEIPGGMEMNMNMTSYPYPTSYVNYPSTPSSTSMSPSSPTAHKEPPRYSSPQPPMHMPVKLGNQSGLKPPMNLGQHTIPTAGSVNLAGSARSVTPLR